MKVELIDAEDYRFEFDNGKWVRIYFWSGKNVFLETNEEENHQTTIQEAFEKLICEAQKGEDVQCLFGEWYAKDGCVKCGPFKTRQKANEWLQKRRRLRYFISSQEK